MQTEMRSDYFLAASMRTQSSPTIIEQIPSDPVKMHASKFVLYGYKNKKAVDFRVLRENVHMDCIQRNGMDTSTVSSLLKETSGESFKIQNSAQISVEASSFLTFSSDVDSLVESRREHSTQYEVAIAKVWEIRITEAISAKSDLFEKEEIKLECALAHQGSSHEKLKILNEFYAKVGTHYVSMCRLGGVWINSKQSTLAEKTRNAGLAIKSTLETPGLKSSGQVSDSSSFSRNEQRQQSVHTSVGGELNSPSIKKWMDSFKTTNAIESSIPIEIEWNPISKLFEESTRTAVNNTMEFFKNVTHLERASEVQAWLSVRKKKAYSRNEFRIGLYAPVGFGKSSLLKCLSVMIEAGWPNIATKPALLSLEDQELSHTKDRIDYRFEYGRTTFIFCDIPGTHFQPDHNDQSGDRSPEFPKKDPPKSLKKENPPKPPKKEVYVTRHIQAGHYYTAEHMKIETQVSYYWRRFADWVKAGGKPAVDLFLLIQKAPSPPTDSKSRNTNNIKNMLKEWAGKMKAHKALLDTALPTSFPVITVVSHSDVLPQVNDEEDEFGKQYRKAVIDVCDSEGYILLCSDPTKKNWEKDNAKNFARLLETVFDVLAGAFPARTKNADLA
ncbi:hypothetical protein BJ742DRAFT_857982 [Cladochytrium replicatum]|nr:hypothetical protein BJ742DRAFT_857982 [Cladochytrium replicatum]